MSKTIKKIKILKQIVKNFLNMEVTKKSIDNYKMSVDFKFYPVYSIGFKNGK